MSTAIKLVESLRQQGVRFELAGDTVKFRGNRELLTPDRIQALKQCKGEVVAFLRSGPPSPEQQAPNPGPVKQTPYGNRPVTWTGKIVSLDEWRRLSEWERHGPGNKMWNGKLQKWE